MKQRAHNTFVALCLSLCFTLLPLTLKSGEVTSSSPDLKGREALKMTQEFKEKYPLKRIHAKLSLECIFCHEGQGNNPEAFKAVREKTCLECHSSKEKIAQRLDFIGKPNPHNSIHDGTRLSCDECHNEHKESTNMCAECHEKEIATNMWMRKTP